MADDIVLSSGSGGDTIAADDIGPGVKYQRVKLTLGADSVNDGDVSNSVPMPIDLREVGGVTQAVTAPVPARISDGTAFIPFPTALVGGRLSVDVGVSALPAGAATSALQLGAGHTVAQTGAPWEVDGGVSHNAGAPAATSLLGTLPALANAAAPTYTEAALVLQSVDLAGATRIVAAALPLPAGAATGANEATALNAGVLCQGDDGVDRHNLQVNEIGGLRVNGEIATGAPLNANSDPVLIGGRTSVGGSQSANIDGDVALAAYDHTGRAIIAGQGDRTGVKKGNITLSTTTETTLLALTAARFHDITMLAASNTSATDVRIDFRDDTAGTIIFSMMLAAAGGGFVMPFPTPWPQGLAGDNWTAQLSTAVTDVRIAVWAVETE